MSEFNPHKFMVKFIPPATSSEPLEGRKYTLTHSDITAKLYLDIGYFYNNEAINLDMRDEVLAEWIKDQQNHFNLMGKVYIDSGEFSKDQSEIRFNVFKKEMNTALQGIVYGDQSFYAIYPPLLDAPIYIYFESAYPQYRQIIYYGTPRQYLEQTYKLYGNTPSRNITLLDNKQADVNGDRTIDNISLLGKKPEGSGDFADQITLAIQDGLSNKTTTVSLQNNAGYNARLFLGDFSKDGVADILISIDTGGSGGYGIFYVYSFRDNNLQEMFNVDKYNSETKFNVNYEDFYKINLGNPQFNVLFTIDISYKGEEYLSQFYNENGKLKQPVKGEVLALGALYPIVTNQKNNSYDLLAIQRIIGSTNSDTLGYVENLLTWDGTEFSSSRLSVAIMGTNL